MQNPTLELQIQTLPDGPGVYQYYDKDENIVCRKSKEFKESFFLF
jgi:excinuclease ABC subunit C